MTRQRIAVVLFLVAAAIAFAWRLTCHSDGGSKAAPGAATRAATGRAAGDRARIDPKTVARGSLAGTVTIEGKSPISHAKVCADGSSHDLPGELFRDSFCVETDDAGRYTIPNLLPARYVISASAKTFRPAVHHPGGDKDKSQVKLAAGEHKTGLDIALRPGGVEITGTVADITGGPIAHAKVWASEGERWMRGRGATVHGETDEQGRFSLWVKPGEATVTAAADGYADNEEGVHAPGKVEILLTPESSLSGTVVDAANGQPVAGAHVLVGTSEWGWDDGETVFSDDQGKFRAQRLTPGRYVAVARSERGYGRTEGSTLVGLGQHVDGVVVKLFPARMVSGKVIIAATKQPCEDAWVSLRQEDRNKWVGVTERDDHTHVAEGVLPGTYRVQVGCEGFRSKDKYEPVVVADKDVTGLVWEVEEGARIRGKVTTKSGEPVEDAEIWAQSTGGAARDKTGWSSATTARDGSYDLTGLKPASYKLEVSSEQGIAPKDGFRVDVAAGATIEKDLVLDDGGKIVGQVVDETGKPVSGVDIEAWPVSDGGFKFSFGGDDHKSDEAGNFAIDSLRAGDYRVTAQRGWRDELRKPGTTDDAKQGEKVTVRVNQTASVKLVVESQSGTIKGTVVDTDGKPVPDAYVSAARESDAAGAQKTSVQQTRWNWDERPNLTTTEGAFTVGKLSPGNYTVRAYRKGGGEAVAEHVAVGSTTKLQIKATGSIDGIVRRAGGGPVPDELEIEVSDIASGFSRTEHYFKTDGKFVVRDVPQGHFKVHADVEGGQKEITVDLAEGEAKTGVVLELEPLVDITGRVVELGTTKPVPGIRMMAQLASGSGRFVFRMGDDEQENVTDESGRFTIKNAPHGKVVLRGWPKDFGDSDYAMASSLKTLDGTGTVDVGDLPIIKKRVKKGDPVGELGVRFAEQPPDTQPDQRVYKVSYIDPAGPAAKSELKVGDTIISIDGVDITGANAMTAWVLMRAPPGTALSLGLQRGATVKVTLAAP
jgi:protocatechuate 3,4-dioxygenase beta subunit